MCCETSVCAHEKRWRERDVRCAAIATLPCSCSKSKFEAASIPIDASNASVGARVVVIDDALDASHASVCAVAGREEEEEVTARSAEPENNLREAAPKHAAMTFLP